MPMTWSVDPIIARQATNRHGPLATVADIANERASVSLLRGERLPTPSMISFIERIASGGFDRLA